MTVQDITVEPLKRRNGRPEGEGVYGCRHVDDLFVSCAGRCWSRA